MKKYIALLLLFSFILMACGGGDDPSGPPEAPQLSFPENNSECFEGTINASNPDISDIQFRWEPANNANSYSISIRNLLTGGSVISESTTAASAVIGLERGVPFSWEVTAIGATASETAKSETWKFFNAGDGIVAHAPFPADLLYPASGTSLNLNGGNSIEVRWSGSDVDNDISGYEVFLDTQNPPTTSAGRSSVAQKLTVTGLTPGNTYFWRVVTSDRAGNKSTSEVSQFAIVN